MKIVFTGGHFSPAYSVIKKIKGEHEIIVIGRRYAFEGDRNETFEYKLCKNEGIAFYALVTGRLQRKFTAHTIPSIFKFPKGVWDAYRILRKVRPDVVVTFGGYLGLPVAAAASLLSIPIVLHEQTQRAGLSSRLIAKRADVVCLSFESSRQYFKGSNIVMTGNPLREEIYIRQDLTAGIKKPFIYVTGGSTGAHAVNEALFAILPQLLEKYTVVHQAGNAREFNDIEKLTQFKRELLPEFSKKYIVHEFFAPKDVAAFFQNADLVISRSGANTVMELMATGAVSILIPLPYGQKSEQRENAKLFESTGLGVTLEQKDISDEGLAQLIHDMINEREKYAKNAIHAQKNVNKDAAEKLVEQIYLYGKRRSNSQSPQQKEKILV